MFHFYWNEPYWNNTSANNLNWNEPGWNYLYQNDPYWNGQYWNQQNYSYWNSSYWNDPYWNGQYWNQQNYSYWNNSYRNDLDWNQYQNYGYWNNPHWNWMYWNDPYWSYQYGIGSYWNDIYRNNTNWNEVYWYDPYWSYTFTNVSYWNDPYRTNTYWTEYDWYDPHWYYGYGSGQYWNNTYWIPEQHWNYQYWNGQNWNNLHWNYPSCSNQNRNNQSRPVTYYQNQTEQHPDRNSDYCETEVAVRNDTAEHVSRWVSHQNLLRSTFPGPLMRNDLDKTELIRFIQWKSLECLMSCEDLPDQQEAYVVWKMMELFCTREETVKWTDITDLLLRTCKSLRKQEDWVHRLVDLLSSSSESEDQQRKAMVKMGDTLASEGLTYAAHVCYTVALVRLGSYRGQTRLLLIGYDKSLPLREFASSEALERTEVYEYVLSLFSGFGQPDFQIFKLIYVRRLAESGCFDQALEYCESIARAVSTFPSSISRSLLKRLVKFSKWLLQWKKAKPEWLKNLRQLNKRKKRAVVLKADTEAEQQEACSASEMDSQFLEFGLMHAGISTVHTSPLMLQSELHATGETSGELLHPFPLQRDVLMEPLTSLVLDDMAEEVSTESDEEPEEQNLQICSFHVECETDQPECGLMFPVMPQTPPLEHHTDLQPVCVPSVQQQHLHFASDFDSIEEPDSVRFNADDVECGISRDPKPADSVAPKELHQPEKDKRSSRGWWARWFF